MRRDHGTTRSDAASVPAPVPSGRHAAGIPDGGVARDARQRSTVASRRTLRSLCTNCRIRSAACDTLSRSCVRRVPWPPGFPLGSAPGSTGSVGADVPLFAGFTATMVESDFSMPFIIDYGLLLSFAIPPQQREGIETSQVLVQCVPTCMGS